MSEVRVHPVILSGGSGTRLWPVSRARHPKQLLALTGDRSLLQETALRVDPAAGSYAAPIVVSNDEHRFLIAAQLQEIGIKPAAHILEPVGRNTAPAIAAAAWLLRPTQPDAVLLVLPADHFIKDIDGFHRLVELAVEAAVEGSLVAFGVRPLAPETGYGYLKAGPPVGGKGVHALEAFREKPDLASARRYIDSGDYYWNSGIFVFRADALLDEMAAFCPAISEGAKKAVALGTRDLDFLRLDRETFANVPGDSIDYAVMEHTTRAVVIPADIGWSDVGSWSALWDLAAKDAHGNAITGDVFCLDTQGSYIRADRRLVATLGVRNLMVVDTPDALLVADRGAAADLKRLVEGLDARGRDETQEPRRVYRPWGYYESIDEGDRHQVKHLCVDPGARLSLQKHHKRSEHWVVVRGTARVTVGEEVRDLGENESVYIPAGTRHRLANPGPDPLSVIEVQSGTYLGEDDIVRFEDDYRRHKEGGKAAE